MPLPITPESVEDFAMQYLGQIEKSDDAQANEVRYDWAWGAAMLLQQHRYRDHANRVFDQCYRVRKSMSA